VTVHWRKLYTEVLHILYSSPGIIRMAVLRRMRWAGNLVGMGITGMHSEFWWGKKEKRYH
jgi:hypothetical protein